MRDTMQGCYVLSVIFIISLHNAFGLAEESVNNPSALSADQHQDSHETSLTRNKRGSYTQRISRGLQMLRLGKRGGPSVLPSPWSTYDLSDVESLENLQGLSQAYSPEELPFSTVYYPYEGEFGVDDIEDLDSPPSQHQRYRRSVDGKEQDDPQIVSDVETDKPEQIGADVLNYYPYVPITDEEIEEMYPVDGEEENDDEKRVMNFLRLGKRQIPMLRLGKRQIPMLRLGKRKLPMLRLGKRGGLSMLRLGKKDGDWSADDGVGDLMESKRRGLSMLRLGKKDSDGWTTDDDSLLDEDVKRGLNMLRLGKRDSIDDSEVGDMADENDKRSMAMLRLGKRPMSMLRLGKRPMSMLRLGKRPMSMLRLGRSPPMSFLRLGKRPMSMLRLGKRPMSMLRLGKRPMSMLRLGKRPMSMLRLGKRPMSMLRLGKRPMSMLRLGKRSMSMLRLGKRPMSKLRLGKRQDEENAVSDLGQNELDGDKDKRLSMLRLGKRSSE